MEKRYTAKKLGRVLGGVITAALIGTSVGVPAGIYLSSLTHDGNTRLYEAELRGRYLGRTGMASPLLSDQHNVSLDSLETLARNAGVDVDGIRIRHNLPQGVPQ